MAYSILFYLLFSWDRFIGCRRPFFLIVQVAQPFDPVIQKHGSADPLCVVRRMAREERKISHKDTKTLRGRESGNSRKKAQKTQNRNFTQSRLPAPSRTPTLWRTGRPALPLATLARGAEGEGEGWEVKGVRGKGGRVTDFSV